jgi:hypothetical protein
VHVSGSCKESLAHSCEHGYELSGPKKFGGGVVLQSVRLLISHEGFCCMGIIL